MSAQAPCVRLSKIQDWIVMYLFGVSLPLQINNSSNLPLTTFKVEVHDSAHSHLLVRSKEISPSLRALIKNPKDLS